MARPRLFIAIGLMFVFVSSAWGESSLFGPSNRARYWEFSIQTRYVGSTDFEGGGGSRLSIEDDLGWGFNVGYNLNEWFTVGGTVSWRAVDYAAHVSSPELDQTFDYSGWMDTANISVNGTWNVLSKRFTPYLQGSAGYSMIDTNIPSSVDMDCWWDPWWGYTCVENASTYGKDAASFTLGGGLSWQPTNVFFIRAGYEKLWLDIDTADNFDVVRFDVGFLYR